MGMQSIPVSGPISVHKQSLGQHLPGHGNWPLDLRPDHRGP